MTLSNAKKTVGAAAMACVVAAGCLGATGLYGVPEASAAPTSSDVMTAYKTKIDQLNKKSYKDYGQVVAKYADLDGNGIEEMLCIYKLKSTTGSGYDFDIYTFKNGKTKRVLSYVSGIIGGITYSQKSKSFVQHSTGHGGELVQYYKLKDGRYKKIASKSRQSVYGGGEKTGKWHYSIGNGASSKTVKKAAFAKKISPLQKGKLHKVTMY